MPSVPLPPQVPIERAGWNTDFSGNVQMPNNDRTPVNPIDVANQTASMQAQNMLRGAQTAGAVNDVQMKQRGMQLSMLSGILNEPDPDKQRQLIQSIVPIANKLNPSYQIDSNIDVPTVRALVQSQVSPEEQVKNQLMQQMYGMKAVSIGKDPSTGALVRMNKLTGEMSPLNPAEQMQYQSNPMAFEASQNQGGIFPNGQNGAFNPPQMPNAAQTPSAPAQLTQEPAFGFNLGDTNPLENKKNLALTQQWQAADQANRPLFQNMQDKINAMRDVIPKVGASGSTLAKIGLAEGGFTGSDESQAASLLDSQANDLAMMATQLQGAKTGNRGSVLQLKTALASKPNSSQYPENNQKLLDEMESKVARADADSALYNAYIETNPAKTIDNNAYKLADALDKKFPILDKNGKLNPDNLAQWKAAIPDAIQHPKEYLKVPTAADEAQAKLPQQQAKQEQSTSINTPEAVGTALQQGKITEAQARQLWASQGLK